jgi:hypothetical protein
MARKITVLRGHDSCGDGRNCPAVIDVEGEEDLFVITTRVTDPELLALLGNRVGPDEELGRMPRPVLLPEVSDS